MDIAVASLGRLAHANVNMTSQLAEGVSYIVLVIRRPPGRVVAIFLAIYVDRQKTDQELPAVNENKAKHQNNLALIASSQLPLTPPSTQREELVQERAAG
jgi:hypothetical protein